MTSPIHADPVIDRKIHRLLENLKTLAEEMTHELDDLTKTVGLRDLYGIKMRTAALNRKIDQAVWASAQIEAVRDIPYDRADDKGSV